MSMKPVTDAEFSTQVLEAEKPVLVDFWAEWCGPCKQIAPFVEEISEEFATDLEVVKLDISENQMTPSQFGVRGIPTLILFKGGEIVDSIRGAHSKDKISSWLKDALRGGESSAA